jgi:bifunctional non-homologous end joining protein LigD
VKHQASALAPFPEIEPQLASVAEEAPRGGDWVHEIKYDGYRLIAEIRSSEPRLLTRHRNDWTDRFPAVARALRGLRLGNAILDGEVVVVGPDGMASFQDLQNVLSGGRGFLRYYLFDVLYLEGRDLRAAPLVERKAVLQELLEPVDRNGCLQFCDHVEGNGPEFLRQARELGLEGIVSKRRLAPYREGRSRDWLKVKCARRQEFVIIGYTDPGGERPGIGALLLAAKAGDGELRFVGRAGSGFSDRLLVELRSRLSAATLPSCPVPAHPTMPRRGAHWVRPELVAEVAFTGWTADGVLRHPTFKGLREDKPAGDVRIERPRAVRGRSRNDASAERSAVGSVAITHPDKVVYPESGTTKRDIVRYFEHIGERMLPLLRNRPLTLLRCPGGIDDCFYQKQAETGIPPIVPRVSVMDDGETAPYAMVDSVEALITLVQLGVLEFHTWGARVDELEKPDRFTIDLDPDPSVPWLRLAQAALEVRIVLNDLGLDSFLKTTGGKGLHVVVPVTPGWGWDEVKLFSQSVAAAVAARAPARYTLSVAKSRRTGRILIDYLRNTRGATAVEAYSTRARPGATVSMPIPWEALATDIGPATFTIRNAAAYLADLGRDPWEGYLSVRQSLTEEMRAALE